MGEIDPLSAWVLERGKLPKKTGVTKEGGVFYLTESLNSETGTILLEYEKFNLYFCYKEIGITLRWPEEMLFAVLEKSEIFSGNTDSKKDLSDFFGLPGLPNRRNENLCSPSF